MSRSNRGPPWEWHDENDPSSTNIDDENLPRWRQPTQPTQHSSWRNTVPSRGSQGTRQDSVPSNQGRSMPSVWATQAHPQSLRASGQSLDRDKHDHEQRRPLAQPPPQHYRQRQWETGRVTHPPPSFTLSPSQYSQCPSSALLRVPASAPTSPLIRAGARRKRRQPISRLRSGSRSSQSQQPAGISSSDVRHTSGRYAPYPSPLGSSATQLSSTSLHSPAPQYRASHAGVVSHSRTKTYPPQGQVPRQPPSVPEHNQSSRSPYLSIEVEAAAAARRRSAISKGLNSHSPVNGEIRRRATLESGEQQPENVALPVTVTRPSLQATSEYARNDQTSKPSQATYSTLTDNAEHLGSLQSAREHRLSDPFDLEEVDLNDVNMDEVDDFLALYDLPTVEGCNHPLSLSLSTTPWSSSSQARKDMKPLTTQGTTSSDPIVLSPSSAPSCPVLHPERLGRRPSLKRPHSPDVCAVETLAAAVHPKKRLRIAPQLDQPTHIPKKQPLLFKNVRDEVTTATIADLVAAVSAEVPGSANIPSAAELVASFNAFSSEGRERAANIIDSCHPFVLTRGALETILSFVSDNDFRGETPPLVLLGALIVFGRLEQATKLIFQDLPGGNLNYDEHFPACKTTKLLAVAHKCLAPPIASRGLSAVLCPKVITVIIRQSAAEDLFDNSHISMNYLSLLASPSNLCVDFDLSFRGSTDIDCNLTFHDEEHQIGRRHEKLDDMAPERGVILGDLVKSVWPSVHVVSFHRGAGKTLPYCGIAVKHVVYCGGGRFCKAEVSFQKRLMTLNTWRENAAEVFFKEVLRVEMQRTTRRKKSTNQPTDDSRRTEMTKRVTLPPILPSRGGATWTTINPVWAAEEAAKRAEERTPMVAKAPLDEAMWDIHLDQLPRNKFLADLEDRVEQLVAEREERDSTKIKKRHVEGVNLKLWMNEEVSCDCCETVCFDTRQPGQAGKKQSSTTKKAATRESSTRKSTRAKKMQGKDGKTRGRSRYKSALARMRYEYE